MTLVGAAGVLFGALPEELLYVVVAVGVAEELLVELGAVEGVVLDADEVVDDVVGGLVALGLVDLRSGNNRSGRGYPLLRAETTTSRPRPANAGRGPAAARVVDHLEWCRPGPVQARPLIGGG